MPKMGISFLTQNQDFWTPLYICLLGFSEIMGKNDWVKVTVLDF